MLEGLLARADHLVIGIGSTNKHDLRNPFTAAETRDMLRLALAGRRGFEVIDVPDADHGPTWRERVSALYGPLDLLVSENAYVRELLAPLYPVALPLLFVPPERRVPIDGTMVRRAIARGEDWARLCPPRVAAYLEASGLVARFRAEFGLETLARDAGGA
jgi:nicotinamide-nucleotide adenylyltransferase